MFNKKVAVIGAGWAGVTTSLACTKEGHSVTVFERGPTIANWVSGNFGGRVHRGVYHYPRSQGTQENCMNGGDDFRNTFGELIIQPDKTLYVLGKKDANGNPPKIDQSTFKKVCTSLNEGEEFNPDDFGYTNVYMGMVVEEPSLALGDRLRQKFEKLLDEAKVKVVCNSQIQEIKRTEDNKFELIGPHQSSEKFDHVINATGYQSLLPKGTPHDIKVVHQPVVAFHFEAQNKNEQAILLSIIDGEFPSIMPLEDGSFEKTGKRKFLLTHAKFGILANKDTPEEAYDYLNKLTDIDLEKIREDFIKDMQTFWPVFTKERFKAVGLSKAVITKVVSDGAFRSAFVVENNGVNYIFPGKIVGLPLAAQEVLQHMEGNHKMIEVGGFKYLEGGILHRALAEIKPAAEKLLITKPNVTQFTLTDSSIKPQTLFFQTAPSNEERNLSKKEESLDKLHQILPASEPSHMSMS